MTEHAPRKKSPKRKEATTKLTCEINGAAFSAEGSKEEVLKKLDEFMDQQFRPLRLMLESMRKTFGN